MRSAMSTPWAAAPYPRFPFWPGRQATRDLDEILSGGLEKMHEAGCSVLGGHIVG